MFKKKNSDDFDGGSSVNLLRWDDVENSFVWNSVGYIQMQNKWQISYFSIISIQWCQIDECLFQKKQKATSCCTRSLVMVREPAQGGSSWKAISRFAFVDARRGQSGFKVPDNRRESTGY